MKRSGQIARSEKPMKRSRLKPVSKKRAAENRRTKQFVSDWCDLHESCVPTWSFPGVGRPCVLVVHHLGHPNRDNDPRNLLRLDDVFHRHYHTGAEVGDDGKRLPPITLGNLIWLKMESDPENFDLDYLCRIRGNRALHPEPLPAFYLELRERSMT